MAKFLLGQSYYLRFDSKLWAAMQPYPPLGTMIAASLLRERGYDVALFDAMLATSEDEWAASLDSEHPDIAILYEDNFNYLSKMCLLRMREAAFRMINMAKARGCTIIVAGSDATDHAARYLEQGADFALIGEGEETLSRLVDHLTGRVDTPLEEISGLSYLYDGQLQKTAPRSPIRDVDALPFPAWDLIDVAYYRQIWVERHGYYSMNMITTRGCPYHCNWCAKPIWGQRYNSRSPENAAAELRWLKETYHPDLIWFADDIMGLKPGWMERFADQVDLLDARVPFKCLSRADLIMRDANTVNALKRAGCQIVWMGAESGSQKVLNAMEKGTTVEQIREAVRRLHDSDIEAALFLQFGYPGETWEDIQATLQMVRECAPDDIGMSVSYPLPGTKFYESVKLQLGDKQNWIDSADLEMMYRGPFTTAFYRQLHIVLHKEFRTRRAWQQMKRLLARPALLGPLHLREAAASIYRLVTLPLAWAKLCKLAGIEGARLAPPTHMTLDEAAQPSPQVK
jgi:anaerobic magnesium-protoporphyrin IX monomethyl ester cyclase